MNNSITNDQLIKQSLTLSKTIAMEGVSSIKKEETYEWLLFRHYAKRIAPIYYAFGLFNKSELVGVITFGCPPNKEYNDGKCIFKKLKIKTLELNRLVVNDGLKKNTLSYFVSQSLKILKKP